MPRTYEPIASQTLGSDTATVTFSSIPGTYTDLILVGDNILNSFSGTGGVSQTGLRFNSDSGTNYSKTLVLGNGSAASSQRTTDTTGITLSSARLSDNASGFIFHIMSYSNSNVFTTVLEQNFRPGLDVFRAVGLWRNTAAITSIDIANVSPNTWKSGSSFALYGIKAA